ncbi:phytanoyl dioxygenase [Nannochloropsis oceanica]
MEGAAVIPLFPSSEDGAARRQVGAYSISLKDKEGYLNDGYIRLPGVLTEEEVLELESVFDAFIEGKMNVPGKDFCDMSQAFGIPFRDWRLVNAMLPREYLPALQNNVLEARALSIAQQLLGEDMALDYDQFLCKRPSRDGKANGAIFAWHQDQAYWPQDTPDYRTVTVSLALNEATTDNGCLRVVPGSHKENKLRQHRPVMAGRDDAHALTVDLEQGDHVLYLPLRRGDVTVHDERIVHGSDGNTSTVNPRKTYVIAFRSKATIAAERAMGFTHSHNSETNWDSWISSSTLSTATGTRKSNSNTKVEE